MLTVAAELDPHCGDECTILTTRRSRRRDGHAANEFVGVNVGSPQRLAPTVTLWNNTFVDRVLASNPFSSIREAAGWRCCGIPPVDVAALLVPRPERLVDPERN